MSLIEEVRAKREDLARVLKNHPGIRRIVEDLYPDSAHFIYELLQNAEDTGATEAHFALRESRLDFEHNGRPFEAKDIYAITDIGEGSKAEEDDKIGRFGVGFKAVFSYSESPQIWSPTYSFQITDLVLPSALAARPKLGDWTRFEFPFNNPKKPHDVAYAEVSAGLSELAETTLLFLSHLDSITWQIGDGKKGEVLRIQHSESHFEVLKQVDGKTSTGSHFLKFDAPVDGLEGQRIAIAFVLDFLPDVPAFDPKKRLAKQLRIVSARPGRVAVFFPADKEASGLRFHLHAPFVPELSRASIKETHANNPLFEQLAGLAASSLEKIRDLGLLTVEFLGVLPNPQDSLPERYQVIRAAIISAMNEEPLTPTHAKSHAPAKRLLQSKASLKELLSDDDLEFLVEHEETPPLWAMAAPQKNSNADRFLSALDIDDWDLQQFVTEMSQRFADGRRYIYSEHRYQDGPDEGSAAWLSDKPIEWHQKLYAFLYSELSPSGGCRRLKDLRIVRLASESYSTGSRCFFPSDGAVNDDVLPRVNENSYTSGRSKSQQENARKFLEEIGVREVGEREQVEATLKQRYVKGSVQPKKDDLRRFIALVENDSTAAPLFADYFILKVQDERWAKPSTVFVDDPFVETGLRAYYEFKGDEAERLQLSSEYLEWRISTRKLVKFAEAVGVQTRLEITETSCYYSPQWEYLRSVGGERHASPIDRDYEIEDLDELLAKPSLPISRLIWRTMCSLPAYPDYLVAIYQRNQTWGARYAASQLVHTLRNSAWVPQGNSNFVRPSEAQRGLLPEGFPFDPGWKWVKAIQFGEAAALRSEELRHKQAFAKNLGFADHETFERAKRFASLPADEQERILSELERRANANLPEHEPTNIERRIDRVSEQAVNAPARLSEERTRSVSVGRDEVKQSAKQYLREQYTNSDGDMICQVCKSLLPFKLDDGSDYFESVEFLPVLKKRHYQNYLALCPNHAAMFMHANGSADSMRQSFLELDGNELEIVLAREDSALYFTRTHVVDLKAVVEVESRET